MGCSHCMNNSAITGKHMSESTFEKVLFFINKHRLNAIYITGGEPTEHPKFLDLVVRAKHKVKFVRIGSNGLFLDNPVLSEQVLSLPVDSIEICNDTEYYPKTINKIKHKKLIYINKLEEVATIGRSTIEIGRPKPFCFDIRKLADKYTDLNVILSLRTYKGKPAVNYDGSLVMGASSCYKIGDIETPDKEIINNIKSMRCFNCTMHNNLDEKELMTWKRLNE